MIITGGIELSVGSMFALIGVVFIDLMVNLGMPWQLALPLVDRHRRAPRRHPRLPGHPPQDPALRRHLVRPPDLPRRRPLVHERRHHRLRLRREVPDRWRGSPRAAPSACRTPSSPSSSWRWSWPWSCTARSIGRYLFAVGKNEEAARFSGINTSLVTATAYIICGGLAGLSAVFIAFYTNSVSPSAHGNFYELYAIAAGVLGGCSLRGGEGSILGIVLGTILLQVLQNLVNLLGIPSSLNFAVMGAVILLGVLADQQLQRRRAQAVARAGREPAKTPIAA